MRFPNRHFLCWMLVCSVFTAPAAAEEFFESPLQPPDTSSPRATLQSFLDNVREAYDVLMPAYESYLAEPSLFPPESAREAEARAQELLERAVRTLNLSEISPALRQKVGLERALLLKEVLDRVPLPPFDAIPGPGGHGGIRVRLRECAALHEYGRSTQAKPSTPATSVLGGGASPLRDGWRVTSTTHASLNVVPGILREPAHSRRA